eukprot:187649_1
MAFINSMAFINFEHYHVLAVTTIHLIACISINAQWISPSQPTLPNSDSNMAIGYYQNTIIILGGYENENDVIEYDSINNVFNKDAGATPIRTTGNSQFYTQMNDMIYIIRKSGERINVFDLSTRTYTTQVWLITHDVDINGCIASTALRLYIIGGYTTRSGAMDNFQILTIATGDWEDGPTLRTARYYTSCLVSLIRNKMYVIGGTGGAGNYQDYLKTIEFLSPTQNQWQRADDLTEPLVSTRAVMYDTHVYIIGGQNSNSAYVTNVHIIDTATNTVSILADELSYGATSMAPIVVGHTLYAFGGWNGKTLNKWQYYQLPTSRPTTTAPSTPLPTTSQPSTSLPTTAKPSTSLPTTKAPSTALPTTTLPTTAKPSTAVPTFALPTTALPTSALPTTVLPTTALPTSAHTTAHTVTNVPQSTTSTETVTMQTTNIDTATTYEPNTATPTKRITATHKPIQAPTNAREREVLHETDAFVTTERDVTITQTSNVSSIIMYIIYGSSVVVLCLCIVFVCCWYKKRHSMKVDSYVHTTKPQTGRAKKIASNMKMVDTTEFGQMLGDNVVATNIMMDDIVEDMNGTMGGPTTDEDGSDDMDFIVELVPTMAEESEGECDDDLDLVPTIGNDECVAPPPPPQDSQCIGVNSEIVNYMITKQ